MDLINSINSESLLSGVESQCKVQGWDSKKLNEDQLLAIFTSNIDVCQTCVDESNYENIAKHRAFYTKLLEGINSRIANIKDQQRPVPKELETLASNINSKLKSLIWKNSEDRPHMLQDFQGEFTEVTAVGLGLTEGAFTLYKKFQESGILPEKYDQNDLIDLLNWTLKVIATDATNKDGTVKKITLSNHFPLLNLCVKELGDRFEDTEAWRNIRNQRGLKELQRIYFHKFLFRKQFNELVSLVETIATDAPLTTNHYTGMGFLHLSVLAILKGSSGMKIRVDRGMDLAYPAEQNSSFWSIRWPPLTPLQRTSL